MDKRKQRNNRIQFFAMLAAVLFLVCMVFYNLSLMTELAKKQTEAVGQSNLENIAGQLQYTLDMAVSTTNEVAEAVQNMQKNHADQAELARYFEARTQKLGEETDHIGIEVYGTSKDWTIIPNMDTSSFEVENRPWYVSTEGNTSSVVISTPYVDARTGEACFTVSKRLTDGVTVVACDYLVELPQKAIASMLYEENSDAIIVDADGDIIAYTNEELIGKNMKDVLPQYMGLLHKVCDSVNVNNRFSADVDGKQYQVFSNATDNGWYLVVLVAANSLYRDTYVHMTRNAMIHVLMLVLIIILYFQMAGNRNKAEKALAVKEDFIAAMSENLKKPLQEVLHLSSPGTFQDHEEVLQSMRQIQDAGLVLENTIHDLYTYSGMLEESQTKDVESREGKEGQSTRFNQYFKIGIIATLILTFVIVMFINISNIRNWGSANMEKEAKTYYYQLEEWVTTQHQILDHLGQTITNQPQMLENYDQAVAFLAHVLEDYDNIAVAYIVNPYWEHVRIASDGKEIPDFDLLSTQWYLDTLKSQTSYHVSAPYYDVISGNYTISMQKIVYTPEGKFFGVVGIDFYLDNLIALFGDSYTEDGYAFLVDMDGGIINHPNMDYQLSNSRVVMARDVGYYEACTTYKISNISKDYDGRRKVALAVRQPESKFTVVVVKNYSAIYGNILLYGILFMALFGACIWVIVLVINRWMTWQKNTTEKLHTAVEEATRAGRAKTDFLAQMSHEIRTPINAVIGMDEMILRETEDESVTEYANNIRVAGQSLLEIVNSILDFSKIEAGKMDIVPVDYNVADMIADLVRMISPKAEKKNLLLQLEIDEKLPERLYGDEVRIRQVVTNLLTNAVKYTHEGSVTLSLQLKEQQDSEALLLFSVKDTGIGIKEEDMERLFQSFSRLEQERNRNIEGTGLGISIVQKLLQLMHSKLQVESEYGKGSNFYFELTQKIVSDRQLGVFDQKTHKAQIKEADTYLYAKGARVLIVDDNEMNLKVDRGLLKRSEIEVQTAGGGLEAIEMLEKDADYDLILMDHMMPVMDGIETMHRIREKGLVAEDVKIIVLTANAITGARETYMAEGFDDYLSKPLEVGALEAKLKEYLPECLVQIREKKPQNNKTASEEKQSKNQGATEMKKEEASAVKLPAGVSQELLEACKEAAKDVDILLGLRYCMDDISFYVEILEEYLSGDKTTDLQSYFANENWDEYRILVHALKSTSLSIGASELSETAKAQEFGVKEDRIEDVKAGHENTIAMYQEIRSQIKALIPILQA